MNRLERKNKEVAEWLGLGWHELRDNYTFQWGGLAPMSICTCRKESCSKTNPNFVSDPLALLRLMREREDFHKFFADHYLEILYKGRSNKEFVNIDYVFDTTGKLLEAVWEWLKQNENDPK